MFWRKKEAPTCIKEADPALRAAFVELRDDPGPWRDPGGARTRERSAMAQRVESLVRERSPEEAARITEELAKWRASKSATDLAQLERTRSEVRMSVAAWKKELESEEGE